jgi:hypothetical protein
MSGSKSNKFVEQLESRQLYSATGVAAAAAAKANASAIHAAANTLPPVFGIDPASLAQAKTDYANGNNALQPAFKSLISSANSALNMTPVSDRSSVRLWQFVCKISQRATGRRRGVGGGEFVRRLTRADMIRTAPSRQFLIRWRNLSTPNQSHLLRDDNIGYST